MYMFLWFPVSLVKVWICMLHFLSVIGVRALLFVSLHRTMINGIIIVDKVDNLV